MVSHDENGKTIFLIGKPGAGTTTIHKKLCGEINPHPLHDPAEVGFSKGLGLTVRCLPSLPSSQKAVDHLRNHRDIIEATPVRSIYIVVRCGRGSDMIDDRIGDLIDAFGDGVCIIATHRDVEASKDGFNDDEVKEAIADIAEISVNRVRLAGNDTDASEIEEFVRSTLLEEPRTIKIKDEFVWEIEPMLPDEPEIAEIPVDRVRLAGNETDASEIEEFVRSTLLEGPRTIEIKEEFECEPEPAPPDAPEIGNGGNLTFVEFGCKPEPGRPRHWFQKIICCFRPAFESC